MKSSVIILVENRFDDQLPGVDTSFIYHGFPVSTVRTLTPRSRVESGSRKAAICILQDIKITRFPKI